MRNCTLALLTLSFSFGLVSCSDNGSGGNNSGGAQAGNSGSSASASAGASGGNKGSAGNGSAGSSAESSTKATTGGNSATGGQSATGGKAGNGGSNGGTGGTAGSASGGQSSPGGASGGTGGVTATGGASTSSAPITGTGGLGGGGSSAKGGGGSVTGGSSGTGAAGTTGKGDAVPSKGCGKTPTLTSGKRSLGSRTFIMRIPETYDKNLPHRLIFAYHWRGGTQEDVDGGGTSGYTWSYYGMREQAGNSTIFVAPQGEGGGWGNGGNSDVIFTDDMYNLITEDLCVDTSRVFAMGFSWGGGMSKALGCQRPKVFRAIAVYAGADFLSGGCDGTTTAPIAYIGLHSVSDPTNAWDSGVAIRERFVSNDGCTKQDPPKPNGLTHVCTKYQGCKDGYPVEWCAFDGGGHTPAPVDGSRNDSGGGDVTWTKAEVWKFFTQF